MSCSLGSMPMRVEALQIEVLDVGRATASGSPGTGSSAAAGWGSRRSGRRWGGARAARRPRSTASGQARATSSPGGRCPRPPPCRTAAGSRSPASAQKRCSARIRSWNEVCGLSDLGVLAMASVARRSDSFARITMAGALRVGTLRRVPRPVNAGRLVPLERIDLRRAVEARPPRRRSAAATRCRSLVYQRLAKNSPAPAATRRRIGGMAKARSATRARAPRSPR